jgi:hypothetical protein
VEHKILLLYPFSESVVAHIAFILHHKLVIVTKTLDDSLLMLGLCFVSGI